MGFQFSATGDDIGMTWPATGLVGDTVFVCGWWYPTTLTAGRRYWASGPTGAVVATTTSEIEVRFEFSQQDWAFVTNGAGITVNKWWFLAFQLTPFDEDPIFSIPAGVRGRIHIGTIETPPQLSTGGTVTNTPTGTGVANTACTLGAAGASGTVGWQGVIGGGVWGRKAAEGDENLAALRLIGSTHDYVLETIIEPIWRGDWAPRPTKQRGLINNIESFSFPVYMDCATPVAKVDLIDNTTGWPGEPISVNGPTASAIRTPRPSPLAGVSAFSTTNMHVRRR